GTDTLSDVEIVAGAGGARFLLVGNGGFDTIQAAIDAAVDGDTILIAAGTYAENLVVDKAVTLAGVGEVILQGTFTSSNGIAGTVYDHLKSGAYSAGDPAIQVAADDVAIKNVKIREFFQGIRIADDIEDLRIEDVAIASVVDGIYKPGDVEVTNLDIIGGSISDAYIGIHLVKVQGGKDAVDVTVDGTTFEHLLQKGIYAETLQGTTLFDNIVMNDVGQYGGGAVFGAPGANGAGIEANLKYGTYVGSITIQNFDFTDVGTSNGLGSSHFNGAAIGLKGRNDGSYAASPADVSGLTVTVQDGTIDGTATGIRLGEPGKSVPGPATTIDNVEIVDAQHTGVHGDVDNVTDTPLIVILDDDENDLLYVAPTATGRIIVNGGTEAAGGADTLELTGGDAANDQFFIETPEEYNLRADPDYGGSAEFLISNGSSIRAEVTEIEDIVIHGGGGADTLSVSGDFAGTSLLTSTIHFDGGAGEDVVDVSGLTSKHRVVADGGDSDDDIAILGQNGMGYAFADAKNIEKIEENGVLVGAKLTFETPD